MEYEYKSLTLSGGGYDARVTSRDSEELNNWFDSGWEYVDSVCQSSSTGTSSERYGSVLVIIRKSKGVGLS